MDALGKGVILLRSERVVVRSVNETRYDEKYGMDKRKSIHAETICIHIALFPLESLEWIIVEQEAYFRAVGRRGRRERKGRRKSRGEE